MLYEEREEIKKTTLYSSSSSNNGHSENTEYLIHQHLKELEEIYLFLP